MEQVGIALSLTLLGGATLVDTDGILAVFVTGAACHLRCRIGQTRRAMSARFVEMPVWLLGTVC